MWFKRRKKSEQDHALSESLRSLQSLLSESGRMEPNLEPGPAPLDVNGPPANGSDRSQPVLASGKDMESEDTESNVPESSDSGSRWKDLNLSFDAEPVAPKPRHRTGPEADEAPAAESENDADTDDGIALHPAPAESGPETEEDPIAGTGPAEAGQPEEPSKQGASADTTGDTLAVEPHIDHPELGLKEPVVFYDELSGPGPGVSGDDAAQDDGTFGSSSDDPDLELDLSESETVDVDGPEASAVFDAGHVEETTVADTESLRESAPAGVDQPETSGITDAGSPERSVAGDVESVEQTVVSGIENLEESGTTDVVAPESDAGDTVDLEDLRAAGSAGEKRAPAGDEATSDDEQPEDQLDLELDSDEAAHAAIPTLTEAVYLPGTSADAADSSTQEPDVPVEEPERQSEPPETTPPGPSESPHAESVERCLDKLRVRLQLMGVDALSPEQEKELHDTLVEFLDDFQPD